MRRLLICLLAAGLAGRTAADPAARPQRVLALHAFEPGLPVDALFTAGLRRGLPLGSALGLYSEHLDRVRFPDPAYVEGFRGWLRAKYATTPPDVIVAIGEDAIEFLADPASTPFPSVPVVFGLVPEETLARMSLPPRFTGVAEHFAVRETLDLARALLPRTSRVVLVGGASAQDLPLNELLRRGVAGSGLEVVELFGLPMAEIQGRLRALPPDAVVLVLSMLRDGAGRQWAAPEIIPALASGSAAPVFTMFSHVVGLGTIGGVVTDFTASGQAVASTVMAVLGGEPVEDIPVQRTGTNRAILDGRQLERWHVPDRRVPAGAEVRFREPSVLRRYRTEIALLLAGFLFQSALIALLLLERRRRWRAEANARESLRVLAHMNRVAALGELVGSLAHEINSPLGAVLHNAEAAERFLARGDAAEVRACLDDVVHDVTRAGEVIRRITAALRREPWAPVALDVPGVVRDALRLLDGVAADRHVTVDAAIAPELPQVTGDAVQLVQVVVNLLLNAFDAVGGLPEPQRRVRVSAEPSRGGVAIRVTDAGPGIPPAIADRVFEPFVTTKPNGLGMGLPISRSIVEAHGGSISVSGAPGGGTVFEVRLPAHERSGARALG